MNMNMERNKRQPITLTDRVRTLTNRLTSRLGSLVSAYGVHPDVITIVGFVIVVLAAVLIGAGELRIGAIVLFIGLPFDALDGAVARAMKRRGNFGALLDSTLDRYADAVIFGSLGYYFAVHEQPEMLLVSTAALIGSYGVSYVRARAEGLGISVKVGMFSRMERTILILVMLFFPELLYLGVWILAIGTNLTTFQRVWFVYNALENREG